MSHHTICQSYDDWKATEEKESEPLTPAQERDDEKRRLVQATILEVLSGPCAGRCMDDSGDRAATALALTNAILKVLE